jgi:hypothetical protein
MADIITFDTAYFQELIKDLGNVSKSLGEAKANLQKAAVGLDSGLVAFAMCVKLNDDIKQINKTAVARINETSGFSKVLETGITRVNAWETTTKNRESGLAAQLGKIWGFENRNSTGDAPSGTTEGAGNTEAPGYKIDIDWTNVLLFLGGIDGLTRTALENAIKAAAIAVLASAAATVATGGTGALVAPVTVIGGAVAGGTNSLVNAEGVEEGAIEGARIGQALDSLENAGYSILDLVNVFSGKSDDARKFLTEALNRT